VTLSVEDGEGIASALGRMCDDEIEQTAIDLKRQIDVASAQLLVVVDEIETRDIPRVGYRLSVTGWVAKFLRMSRREASGLVKTARSLAKMPDVAARALKGEITASGVKQLALARDRYPDEFARSETKGRSGGRRGSHRQITIPGPKRPAGLPKHLCDTSDGGFDDLGRLLGETQAQEPWLGDVAGRPGCEVDVGPIEDAPPQLVLGFPRRFG
jgi:hypothetical protein